MGLAGAPEAAGVSHGDGAELLVVSVWPAVVRRRRAEEEERGGTLSRRRASWHGCGTARGERDGGLELAGEVRGVVAAGVVAEHGGSGGGGGGKIALERGWERMAGGVGVRYF